MHLWSSTGIYGMHDSQKKPVPTKFSLPIMLTIAGNYFLNSSPNGQKCRFKGSEFQNLSKGFKREMMSDPICLYPSAP
jgi:hypothetical protein